MSYVNADKQKLHALALIKKMQALQKSAHAKFASAQVKVAVAERGVKKAERIDDLKEPLPKC